MYSRFQETARLLNGLGTRFVINNKPLNQNVLCKRWSGHNTMDITPSNYGWKNFKDLLHFWTIVSAVPVIVITTIMNIRANPELTEIPEGYEPRHWEYYKHPFTRWQARYMFIPFDLDEEQTLAFCEMSSENRILRNIEQKVDSVMKFYNDHRSKYFLPFYGEYVRRGRTDYEYGAPFSSTSLNEYYDVAYDPKINPVPTEGYKSPDY